ncbi:hypothetical protein DVH05_015715 [Phytophthora capsici]|nr:hypothetical protein DVH05_015715 [Phytophthora capsici]
MGVSARPMPTKPVCDTFDKLRQDAVGLLSLRKHLKSKQTKTRRCENVTTHTNGQGYKSITTPGTLSDRPGDAALGVGTDAGFGAAHAQAISKALMGCFVATPLALQTDFGGEQMWRFSWLSELAYHGDCAQDMKDHCGDRLSRFTDEDKKKEEDTKILS